MDEGARKLGLLEAPATPQEPMGVENDVRTGRGPYHTKKTTLKTVLNEVFPSGVPSRDELPDMELIYAVIKSPAFIAMKKRVSVHNDTILRAAGRRQMHSGKLLAN